MGNRFESNFGKFVQNSVTKIVKLGRKSDFTSWLPDGYSQILRSYVFCPSGFWKMAPVHYAAKFDPFLSLDCARVEGMGAISKVRKGSNFSIWQPCITSDKLD